MHIRKYRSAVPDAPIASAALHGHVRSGLSEQTFRTKKLSAEDRLWRGKTGGRGVGAASAAGGTVEKRRVEQDSNINRAGRALSYLL